MTSIAIEDRGFGFPELITRERDRARRGCKRFLSKKVRTRNEESSGTSLWQPSRALYKPKPVRAQELQTALREEYDEQALTADEFWSTRAIGYKSCVRGELRRRRRQEELEIAARHVEILSGIETELREQASHELELRQDPVLHAARLHALASSADIGDLATAALLEEVERPLLELIAA